VATEIECRIEVDLVQPYHKGVSLLRFSATDEYFLSINIFFTPA
jgi:hypothetical protein